MDDSDAKKRTQRKYRKINPAIWNDEKFVGLSERGRLIFFFLLTHPHMTMLGAMRANIPGLAAEYGIPEKAFREAFREAFLEGCGKGMVEVDEGVSLIVLPNFPRHNEPESPNVVMSYQKALPLLPECALRTEQLQRVKAFLEAKGKAFHEALPKAFHEALSKGLSKAMSKAMLQSGAGAGAGAVKKRTPPDSKPSDKPYDKPSDKPSEEEPSPPTPDGAGGAPSEAGEEGPPISHFLAVQLVDCIRSHKPDWKEPANLKAWEAIFERMVRIDQRDPGRISEVIAWATSDTRFWQKNVLSAEAVRKHFDRIEIEMRSNRGGNREHAAPAAQPGKYKHLSG